MLISSFFDLVLTPFQSLPPFWPLLFVSVATALLILVVFRVTSNPERIKETKDRIKAHILEMWLFRDSPRIILSAQLRIFRLNGRYLRLTSGPFLVMLVPLSVMLIALDGWFRYRPMRPGEHTIVSLWVSPEKQELLERISLQATSGVEVETPPLRIPPANEVDWRIRAKSPGVHRLSVEVGGQTLEKQLIVSENLTRVAPSRVRSAFRQNVLYPGDAPIPDALGVERFDVLYPDRTIRILQWDVHWILGFFVLSCIGVFAFKRLLRVEI